MPPLRANVLNKLAITEAFLGPLLPPLSPRLARLRDLVKRMAIDRSILRVDDVSRASGLDTRALQRLFRTYVGVSPKWVIQRYRLHEARARAITALARLSLWCLRHAREPWELVDRLGAWADLVREIRRAPNGMAALVLIMRYIFATNEPDQPEALVQRLLAAVGDEVRRRS